MTEKRQISDGRLEEMLLSLRQSDEAEESIQPPVINTFRLQMEAKRRREKRQVQAVTLAAWFSVTATIALIAYFALVMLPKIERTFSPETRRIILQVKQSFASYGVVFAVLGAVMLLGYLLSAALLIAKMDVLLKKHD